ncbi:MAG: prokaryotic n-terminal methylation site [Akkermansiaceae bacterium]|nr:prokaryotic n-terminal methylation site [Akkermansiaceae bacterium]
MSEISSDSEASADPLKLPVSRRLRGRKSRSALLLIIGGGCGLLVFMGLILSSVLRRSNAYGDGSQAINNIKQVGLALQEFEEEYGRFPDDSTAAKVKADTATPLTLGGRSSNSFFRQLLATGMKSEKPFYARRAGARYPDGLFADDAHALSPGECGFAYVAGLSSKSDPGTPVVMAPMVPGTTRFDPSIYGGKAIILRLDNSASGVSLDSSGRAMLNGMDLFDPRQPFWHGKAPDLRWPE